LTNLYPTLNTITREEKQLRLSQKPKVFWMTGLSGSGKSTLATILERTLFEQGYHAVVLDGDNIRGGINNNHFFT
jgi:adenylylsulfate kinase